MAEEQSLQASEAGSSKRPSRSLGRRCLVWAVWGAGLGVVASIATYRGNLITASLFAILPAVISASTAVVSLLVTMSSILLRRHAGRPMLSPGNRRRIPIFCGMTVFSLATVYGVGRVALPTYQRDVESRQRIAVEAVEDYRLRTGQSTGSNDNVPGLPRHVSCRRSEEGDTYTLYIGDKYAVLQGWRYRASTKKWTYGYDYD